MTTFFHQRENAGRRLAAALESLTRADCGVLTTSRLTLRPLGEPDREAYMELLAEARWPLADCFPLHRLGETDEQVFERHMSFSRAARANGRAWRRLICLADGTIAGAVNINNITYGARPAGELGFWVRPSQQRRGIAAEALAAVLTRAMAPRPAGLGLDRVWAYVAPTNPASLKLMYALGLARKADAAPVQLNLSGRWKLHHVYEITGAAEAGGAACGGTACEGAEGSGGATPQTLRLASE